MRLPSNAWIAPEKLTNDLLVYKKRNDKSEWLAQAGYSLKEWKRLESDLRDQILPLEATLIEETAYGLMYEISGPLTGPSQKTLAACTI